MLRCAMDIEHGTGLDRFANRRMLDGGRRADLIGGSVIFWFGNKPLVNFGQI